MYNPLILTDAGHQKSKHTSRYVVTYVLNVVKVIIIGAGPAGLLAALRLTLKNKLSVTVYEIRPEPATLGGAVGIPSNGLRVLDRLGVYTELAACGSITPNIAVHSVAGRDIGKKSTAAYSEAQTGFGYLRIRRTDLVDVLFRAVKRAEVTVNFGMRLAGIEEDHKTVKAIFEDGTVDSADFMLGCDGIHSSVRHLYVDPSAEPEYTGISNIYSLVETSSLPKTSSDLADLNVTLTQDGLFAVSACTPDKDMAYWFFSREVSLPAFEDCRDGWEQRGKKEIDGMKSLLLQLLGDSQEEWTCFLRDTLAKSTALRFYPIYHVPLKQKWSRGRCLLLGDAAHAMPPHVSQGTSMAAEDVALLSNLLSSGAVSSIEDLVNKYEATRRPRTTMMMKAAVRSGDVRKKVDPWRLRANEIGYSVALWVNNTFNLERLGLGQKALVYDIEAEKL